jgi:ribosomal protein S18 acetylase RimI-like enzyme
MNTQYRGYQESDLDFVQELMLELGYSIDCHELRGNIQDIIRRGGIIIVAEREREVIGSVCAVLDVRLAEGMYAEIVSLVVSGNHRRKGIGKSLIKEAENWAKKHVKKIRVRANTTRRPAHLFYESLGYQETKEQKVFIKIG